MALTVSVDTTVYPATLTVTSDRRAFTGTVTVGGDTGEFAGSFPVTVNAPGIEVDTVSDDGTVAVYSLS